MKKRVIIFSREYPPVIVGGTAIVARSSAEGLRDLGYDITVITCSGCNEYQDRLINGIRIISIPGNTYEKRSGLYAHNLKYHKTVIDCLKRVQIPHPDIILMPDLFSYPEAFIFKKMLGVPLINILLQDFRKILVYDKDTTHQVTNCTNGSALDLYDVEKKAVQTSDYNVFISHALSDSISEQYSLAKEKYEVVYLGIDPVEMIRKSNVDYELIRSKIIPNGKKVIGTIGRLVPFKGFDGLIRAFHYLHDDDPNLFLLIIGTGPEKEYLQNLINNLGLDDCALIIYNKNREETVSMMQICDIAVVPSLWESFCYVAAEFMAMAKPLVVSGVDSLNELMIHGETGLICPVNESNNYRLLDYHMLASHIKQLLDDPKRASIMAENAKKRTFQLFTQKKYALGLDNIIQRMLR